MKRFLAGGLTLLLLLAALWGSVRPGANDAGSDSSGGLADPVRTVEQSFLAAEQGDIDGYLARFAGSLRQRLEHERKLQGDSTYRATLRQNSSGQKGRVIEPVQVASGANEVGVRVERIYAHHHERQDFRLRRDGDGWRIFDLGPVERFQPRIPYGTPVSGS